MYYLIKQSIRGIPAWEGRSVSEHRTIHAAQARFIKDYRRQKFNDDFYWRLTDEKGTVLDHKLEEVFDDFFHEGYYAPVLMTMRKRVANRGVDFAPYERAVQLD